MVTFLTALPADATAGGWAALSFGDGEVAGPLAGLSLVLGAVWLAVLLRVDAVISPADTGLIYAGVTPAVVCERPQRQRPPSADRHARGIPRVSVLLMFVVGCLFFLPFPGWQQFIGFITFRDLLRAGRLVVGALRRQLPGGDLLPYIAFLASGLCVLGGLGDQREDAVYASAMAARANISGRRAPGRLT